MFADATGFPFWHETRKANALSHRLGIIVVLEIFSKFFPRSSSGCPRSSCCFMGFLSYCTVVVSNRAYFSFVIIGVFIVLEIFIVFIGVSLRMQLFEILHFLLQQIIVGEENLRWIRSNRIHILILSDSIATMNFAELVFHIDLRSIFPNEREIERNVSRNNLVLVLLIIGCFRLQMLRDGRNERIIAQEVIRRQGEDFLFMQRLRRSRLCTLSHFCIFRRSCCSCCWFHFDILLEYFRCTRWNLLRLGHLLDLRKSKCTYSSSCWLLSLTWCWHVGIPKLAGLKRSNLWRFRLLSRRIFR